MKESAHPKFRRRRFLIKKGLQSRFILGFSLAVLSGFCLDLFLAYFLIDRELAAGLYKSHIKIRSTAEIALPVFIKLSAVTVPAIIAISAVIGYYLTHSLERPLLSFNEALKGIGQGDLTQRLPEAQADPLPEAFNKTSSALGASLCSIKEAAAGLEKSVERFHALLNRESSPQKRSWLIKALHGITEESGRALKELSRFKV
ncbi:MAG: methyl-accepting chemotaxis protein [Deltaproteobacteria bacterium]|nr:methyl-accepting chemotaxis protein [Deltaproteobacteria bacterium]MBI5810423.1 methyl-accepting chemotaxis protein [Deltaproteobacteria bacterium]